MRCLVQAVFVLLIASAFLGCGRKPLTPAAPWTDVVDDSLFFLATTTDPSGLGLEYLFDWGDGVAFTTRRYQSGETAYIRHTFTDAAWHEIKVQARNENGKSSAWSPPLRFRKSHPPVIVDDSISGLVRWAVNRWYRASVRVTDPDGDSVRVKFIWDGDEGGTWTELAPSGSTFTDSGLWTATGPHTLKVVAKDKGNMVARSKSAKTVNVSGMGITWYNCSEERSYCGTPTLGSIDGEPVVYFIADEGLDCCRPDGSLRWTAAAAPVGFNSASLSSDGSRLYLCDYAGLVCLDARTGQRKWILPLDTVPEAEADCTPTLGPDGAIYITITGWYDYELARVKDCGDSAVLQWLVDLGDGDIPSAGAVVGRNGVVYVFGELRDYCYDRLFALDSTGTVLWIDSTTVQGGCVPVIDSRGRLLVSDEYGACLLCFNPDGSLAWSVVTGELYPGSTAVGPDDEVIVIDWNGAVVVIDSAGHQQWSTGLSLESMNTPCVADNGCIVAFDPSYSVVYCMSSDGQTQWEFSIRDSLGIERRRARSTTFCYDPSPVIGTNGDLYLTGYDGIFCLSGADLHLANAAWPTFNHDNARSGWAGRQQR